MKSFNALLSHQVTNNVYTKLYQHIKDNSVDQITDIHQKALSINLNKSQYGTIAEIGAGQETARWFFLVGGAAGTIAKAMSAYDMTFSDSIYGKSPRYVSRERLNSMLDYEYKLVVERLDESKGADCTFFAFSNTVASRSFSRDVDGHGWLGIKFQTSPRSEPSRIDIHVHLTGKQAVTDQETLGVLGVNLIYGALTHHKDAEKLLQSLMDELDDNNLEIDMVDFSGPAFEHVDNRLMALKLVQFGMTHGAMFNANGEIVHPADVLYKKAVLVERSRFNPPTLLNMDMLDCAQKKFLDEHDIDEKNLVVISEMTTNNLRDQNEVDTEDFLRRADVLCALGKNVLISDMDRYFRLASYLFRATQMPVGIALGIPTLRGIFNEKYYEDLPGGILEAFGRLFKYDLRLYVAPCLDEKTDHLTTIDNYEPEKHLSHLYHHLVENGHIASLNAINKDYLCIHSHDVLEQIKCGSCEWEDKVPDTVREIIKKQTT